MESTKTVDVLLLCNFTPHPLANFVESELKTFPEKYQIRVGEFNQVIQELGKIEEIVGVNQHVFVLLRREDFLRELKFVNYGFRNGAMSGLELYSSFLKEIATLSSKKGVTLYLSDLFELGSGRIHKLNHLNDTTEILVDKFDSKLNQFLKDNSEIRFINVESIISEIGHLNSWNPSQEFLFRQPMTVKFCQMLAKQIAEEINFSFTEQTKVIAVDADNTLWGGVIGEDPWDQIEVGQEYPGLAYRDFQEFLLIKKSEGVLLVLVTKNNSRDIEDFFSNRKDMPLKLEDFAAVESNWNRKSESIYSAANKLNVRLESIIFIDDSPLEIAEVESVLPGVKTFLLPEELQGRLRELGKLRVLWSGSESTIEDRHRTMYIQHEQGRRNSAKNLDPNSYLKSLELKLTVQEVTSEDTQEFIRVVQLLNKTNQFNLTCERVNDRKAKDLLSENRIFIGKLVDKFGDYGLIAAGIVLRSETKLEIKNLVVSCRALGRCVEQEFLKFITSKIQNDKTSAINATYIKNQKNVQIPSFLLGMGFQVTADKGNEVKYLRSGEIPSFVESYIEIVEEK